MIDCEAYLLVLYIHSSLPILAAGTNQCLGEMYGENASFSLALYYSSTVEDLVAHRTVGLQLQ